MWNMPTNDELAKLPAFYSTENVPLKEKIVQMHFWIGGCDWFPVEFSPDERCFFGFAILNDDLQNAEWGYFSLDELASLRVKFLEVDRDLHWNPCKAVEVDKIREAEGWLEEVIKQ